MSEVSTAILAKIGEMGNIMADFDQRSALGMARSWINHGTLDTWHPERHFKQVEYPKRDQLAKDLVAILEESGADEDEMIAALNEARRVINLPYLDPSMNGQQAHKASLKPSEKKKGEKS